MQIQWEHWVSTCMGQVSQKSPQHHAMGWQPDGADEKDSVLGSPGSASHPVGPPESRHLFLAGILTPGPHLSLLLAWFSARTATTMSSGRNMTGEASGCRDLDLRPRTL